MRVTNSYANHSWGIVAEFRVDGNSGSDRPSILFSSGQTGTTWSTGFGYNDDNFRINQNHGYRNGSWGTTRILVDTAGRLYSYFETRTPFIYDNNNTGYYWNGDGTSRQNQTEHVGRLWFSNYLVSRNQGGMMGDYNATGTRAKVIWTIGESWPIGNMYGLAYEYGSGYDHHLALKNNGTTYHRISFASQGAFFSGNVQAGSSHRAPIFYDTNNTGYYMDPTSDSNWNGLTRYGQMRIGLTGKSQYRRNNYTSDTRYWTGAMGWGRTDLITMFDQGSGFIDTWSNPANQPAGTSHWVGFQASHYNGGYNSGYGIQIVGGPIQGLWHTSYWSSKRSWYKIAMYDLNEYSNTFYSTVMYDSNDTGYRIDPNSSSQLRSVYANDWFRPQGCSGLYFQDYGYGMRAVQCEGGEYGNVATYGSGVNGWEGYNISGRAVFMHDGGSATGLYNDVENEWILYSLRNSYTYLYYNGGWRVRADSGGIRVNNWVYAEGDVIAYYSDERLKDIEGDIENALDKVGKLRGFYYRNNKEANMIGYEGNDLQIGVSAQDVESVLPEIVYPAPKAERLGYDYKTVKYDRLVPLLVNAINEQKDIVESQKEEIEYLKSELSEMKEMMKQLLNKK